MREDVFQAEEVADESKLETVSATKNEQVEPVIEHKPFDFPVVPSDEKQPDMLPFGDSIDEDMETLRRENVKRKECMK